MHFLTKKLVTIVLYTYFLNIFKNLIFEWHLVTHRILSEEHYVKSNQETYHCSSYGRLQ